MSTTKFQMSDFRPIDGTLVNLSSQSVAFNFSSAYATSITVELWSEDDQGAQYAQRQDTTTNGNDDAGLGFADVPPGVNLHYKITVSGESGSQNTVYVTIEW
jgi:hypothetical protein